LNAAIHPRTRARSTFGADCKRAISSSKGKSVLDNRSHRTSACSGRGAVRWQVPLSFRWIGFGTWRHRAAEAQVRWASHECQDRTQAAGKHALAGTSIAAPVAARPDGRVFHAPAAQQASTEKGANRPGASVNMRRHCSGRAPLRAASRVSNHFAWRAGPVRRRSVGAAQTFRPARRQIQNDRNDVPAFQI
jgi:hypothetical protein